MVITSYTFFYIPSDITATGLAIVLQPLCSNAAAPMQ